MKEMYVKNITFGYNYIIRENNW